MVFDLREQGEMVGAAGKMVEDSQGGDEVVLAKLAPGGLIGNISENKLRYRV